MLAGKEAKEIGDQKGVGLIVVREMLRFAGFEPALSRLFVGPMGHPVPVHEGLEVGGRRRELEGIQGLPEIELISHRGSVGKRGEKRDSRMSEGEKEEEKTKSEGRRWA